MPRLYNEYISVDSDFIPVFSVHSDREFPTKWKSFYAHDSFKSIIKQLLDSLEMSTVEKNKPIWMSGAYGTGKTYASFVIKHLLEDDLESVKSYCESNHMMDIYARIAGLRSKGKVLVVHRSSSASIIGENRLFNAIIESVKSSLKANGYEYLGQKSQYDRVLSTLKDSNSSFNFANAFQKHKSKFTEYAKPESVIRTLENYGIDDVADLLQTIVEIAEKEGFNWTPSVADVINWINDVVKTNELHSIVFIWDEFTEFFKNNKSNITGLQAIAESAPSSKFYFFLITHGNAQIISDLSARKVIEARFKQCNLEMAEATAFILMSQAIKKTSDLKNEWDLTVDELWHKVELTIRNSIIRNSPDTKESELKALLPIHPYAAYLLKVIAKDISSNQRTMFQFLSGDYKDGNSIKTNFRWFIDNYTNTSGEWNFLTADSIWTYFFTDENVDLDSSFRTVISHYNNFVNVCGDDENKKRVLRVALLLTGMQQKSGATRAGGQSGLLRPTLNNISATFIGTPIEDQIVSIMSWFEEKKVFSSIQESDGDTLYVPPVGTLDEDKFNKIKDDVAKSITFEKLIADQSYNIYEQFKLSEYLPFRYEIFPITPNNYKDAVEKANNLRPNKIALFYLFAKNEGEQAKVNEVIKKIYEGMTSQCVVVDFSDSVITDATYDKFLTSKAEESYYEGNASQNSHYRLAMQNAETIIREWKTKLFLANLQVYTAADKAITLKGGSNLRKKLKEINHDYFGCGLEEISINEKLFSPQGFKDTVVQMGMSKMTIPGNFSYLNTISSTLAREGIWGRRDYVINNPNHVVSRMKASIDEVINEGFKSHSQIALTAIWDVLIKPPYGLLSCTGTAFLLGFLLSEYSEGLYYKYDGTNTEIIDYRSLSDLIFSMVKEMPKVKSQYIIKQKPEHAEICRISGDLFKIPADKRNSLTDVTKNIKLFLQKNEYPLWCLIPYIQNELTESSICDEAIKAIELYCEFIAPEKLAGRDEPFIAEELYKLFKSTPMLDKELCKIITSDCMKEGMNYYICSYKDKLIEITQDLGVPKHKYLAELNKKLSADASYLWNKGDVEHQIDNLYEDYLFINNLNLVLSEKKSEYNEIRSAIDSKLKIIRLPLYIVKNDKPNLSNLLDLLLCIRKNEHFIKSTAIKILEDSADEFNEFYNNQSYSFERAILDYIDNNAVNDEIRYLFTKVSSNMIDKSIDQFKLEMNDELSNYRRNKKVNRLKELWVEKTGTKTARELSTKLLFPILIAFSNSSEDSEVATEIFDIVNGERLAMDKTIDRDINFIQSNKLDVLFNESFLDKVFIDNYLFNFRTIIQDISELKNTIVAELPDVYSWGKSNYSNVKKIAEEYANKLYKDQTIKQVKDKIKNLKQETIAQYLAKLIETNPLVGIAILQEEE